MIVLASSARGAVCGKLHCCAQPRTISSANCQGLLVAAAVLATEARRLIVEVGLGPDASAARTAHVGVSGDGPIGAAAHFVAFLNLRALLVA
jgi:hypothetical protein